MLKFETFIEYDRRMMLRDLNIEKGWHAAQGCTYTYYICAQRTTEAILLWNFLQFLVGIQ